GASWCAGAVGVVGPAREVDPARVLRPGVAGEIAVAVVLDAPRTWRAAAGRVRQAGHVHPADVLSPHVASEIGVGDVDADAARAAWLGVQPASVLAPGVLIWCDDVLSEHTRRRQRQ